MLDVHSPDTLTATRLVYSHVITQQEISKGLKFTNVASHQKDVSSEIIQTTQRSVILMSQLILIKFIDGMRSVSR